MALVPGVPTLLAPGHLDDHAKIRAAIIEFNAYAATLTAQSLAIAGKENTGVAAAAVTAHAGASDPHGDRSFTGAAIATHAAAADPHGDRAYVAANYSTTQTAIDLSNAQVLIAAQAALISSLTSRVNALEGAGGGTGGTGGAGTITVGTVVQSPANGVSPGSATTVAATITVASGTHELLVFVFYGGNLQTPNQVTSITLTGDTAVFLGRSESTTAASSTARGCSLYRITNPTVGVGRVITANLGASQFGEIVVVPLTSSTGSISYTTLGTDGSAAGNAASCTAGSGAGKYFGATVARTVNAITPGGTDTALITPGNTNSTISVAIVSSPDNTLASSWAPTTAGTPLEYAAIMVGAIAGSSSSSPDPIPTGARFGLTEVFSEDFATDTAVGTWTTASTSSSTLTGPAAYTAKWGAYPTGYNDTSGRGHYDPGKGISTLGGVMKCHMAYDPVAVKYACVAPVPKLPSGFNGGVIESHWRVTHGSDTFKWAWLFWPDSGIWPAGGEIDFPECNLTSRVGAFQHYARAAGGQDGFPSGGIVTPFVNDGAWHTSRTVWVNGTRVDFYLDNILIGSSTNFVPTGAMHFVFQSETNIGGTVNTADTADFEIAWVKAYA